MTKKKSRLIALIMLLAALVFVWYALNNPQTSFPWSNTITFTVYILYIAVMIYLFIASSKK